jgi:tetratricopeptide (TPR) repeat protein
VLGRRIRALRLRLGLSQQQLAGPELSRSFICLVEQGKCNPSSETLRLIAERLGKPVSYFFAEAEPDQELAVDRLLYTLEQQRERLNREMLPQVRTALAMAQRLQDPALEARAYFLLGWIHLGAGEYDEAIETLEEAAELFQMAQQNRGRAEALNTAGAAAFFADHLDTARRYWSKSLRLTAERKDLTGLRARVLINLGSCLLRLGQHETALRCYQEASSLARSAGLGRGILGNALYGIGICWQQMGDVGQAQAAIEQAVELFEEVGDASIWDAKQVLAAILAAQGRAEEAQTLFAACQMHFRREGDCQREASLHEDLATCHWQSGRLAEARSHAELGLRLLQQAEGGFVRGRLYRLLGQIAAREGQVQRARELFDLSLELFRRMKSWHEYLQTEALLKELDA